MNYYKIDIIKDVLRHRFSARQVSAGPKPRIEVWERTAAGNRYVAFLMWEHGEEIVSEEELTLASEALALPVPLLLGEVKARGGLWLGPSPPG